MINRIAIERKDPMRSTIFRATAAAAVVVGALATTIAANAADDVAPTIIGGHPATETYPFIVSMQKEFNGDPNTQWCGGALIAPDWVLLAGHCVTTEGTGGAPHTPIDPATVHVRVGSNDRTTGGTTAGVARIVVHPDYANLPDRSEGHDVALLQLDKAVGAQPVALTGSEPAAGTRLRQVGWGYTSMDDAGDPAKLPVALQELDSPVVPADTPACVADPTAGDAWGIRAGDFCVDNPDGVSGSCGGDSGSPALRSVDGRWEVVGVTSRGPGDVCGATTDIYTSVAQYRDWITTNIGS